MKQTIRIIGGDYRGKKLPVPNLEGLRPTPDRVRETLFNWLMHDIRDARCLDAFAGSGALGFEAFSRGAASVTLLEQHRAAYLNLKKIVSNFHSSRLSLKKIDALEFLNQTDERFDIIFLDPPFAKNDLPLCLDILARRPLLTSGGLLYLEAPKVIDVDQNLWHRIKLKQAGQVTYALYRRY